MNDTLILRSIGIIVNLMKTCIKYFSIYRANRSKNLYRFYIPKKCCTNVIFCVFNHSELFHVFTLNHQYIATYFLTFDQTNVVIINTGRLFSSTNDYSFDRIKMFVGMSQLV